MSEADASATPPPATPPVVEEEADNFAEVLGKELDLLRALLASHADGVRARLLAAHAAAMGQQLETSPTFGATALRGETLVQEPESPEPRWTWKSDKEREPVAFSAGRRGSLQPSTCSQPLEGFLEPPSRLGSMASSRSPSPRRTAPRSGAATPKRGSLGSSTTTSTDLSEEHRMLVPAHWPKAPQAEGCRAPPGSRSSLLKADELPSFRLHRVFGPGRETLRANRCSVMLLAQPEDEECLGRGRSDVFGDSLRSEERCQRMVISPVASYRIAWDCAGSILVAYDVIMVPLATFGLPPDVDWATIVSNVSTLFWTLDLVLSFLTGFDSDTGTEMRPSRIARNYAKSWLVPDATVVIVDWALILFAPESSDLAGLLRLGRQARALRILRAVKLVRMMKVLRTLRKVLDSMQSGYSLVIAQIFELLLCIMLINHYIACGWYGLCDRQEWAKGKASTWAEATGTTGRGLLYEYTTSLHWAMTQFTPASMDVFPTNDLERLFNIFVLLLGLVMFSSFVSSITALITQLRNLVSERVKEEAQLREFLHQSKVSMVLGVRIKTLCRNKHKEGRRRIYEADVPALTDLPMCLRAEMRREIFGPSLLHHPVFELLLLTDTGVLTLICNRALAWTTACPGASLFDAGDLASAMFIVAHGIFDYAVGVRGPAVQLVLGGSDSPSSRHLRRGSDVTTSTSSTEVPKSEASPPQSSPRISPREESFHGLKVRVGDCLCEPALWGSYVCRGRAVCTGTAEAARICADRFRAVIAQRPDAMAVLRPYATLMADELNEVPAEGAAQEPPPDVSDLGFSSAKVRALVRQAAELSVPHLQTPSRLDSFLQERLRGFQRMSSKISLVQPEPGFDDIYSQASRGIREFRPFRRMMSSLGG